MNGPGPMGIRNSSEDPVSPELALVDPVLAADLRARLAPPWADAPGWPVDEPARLEAVAVEVDEPFVAANGPGPPMAVQASAAGKTRSTVPTVAAAGLAVAAAVASAVTAVILVGGHDRPPSRSAAPSVQHAVVPAPPPTPTPAKPTPTKRAPTKPTPVKPTPARPQPAKPKAAPIVRTLAWAPVSGAGSYEIQLFRGSHRVFLTRKRETRLVVGPSWRYSGKTFRLVPGTYRWYVWPVSASGTRQKEPLVQALVQIARS